MVVRYPAFPAQLASTSSASRSARLSPAPLWWGFRRQAPAAVAPGYLLKGAGLQKLPDAKRSRTPDLPSAHKAEVTMRSAKNTPREAGDRLFAPSAGTAVHRCRPFAVLKVSCFTAVAPQVGARALLEPRQGAAGGGWGLSPPAAGGGVCLA